ncbi:MAG: DUF1850 domain-containing protein [Burkholderiaceae bacterium]|nr:DUF1850 domain-containing protein [Burkholderiaceae bacterium]
MSLCLATSAIAISLSLSAFTLRWEHSVEKTGWEERWRATPDGLVLEEARIRGSGAGMEPPDNAELKDGWWVYPGALPPQQRIRLAVSGATGKGWQLCTDQACRDIEQLLTVKGKRPKAIEISQDRTCARLRPSPQAATLPASAPANTAPAGSKDTAPAG